jgi:hypothetical protein
MSEQELEYGLCIQCALCIDQHLLTVISDFGDQFPSAEVIGVDISPTQPTFTAPNVKFELDDVQLEWTYQPNSFDYIHVRCMLGAIQDWAHLYREIYK